MSEKSTSSLAKRFLSAAVLAPPVLAAVYSGPPFFDILVGLCALILAWEWSRMYGPGRNLTETSITMNRGLWLIAGAAYILPACAALLWLRSYELIGREIVLFLFIVVWVSDTGAYAFGSLIGGPRLA
ncbi:MAG: phosphatidate cytidylyltransferase, partial [Rhodospirillales bacterium]